MTHMTCTVVFIFYFIFLKCFFLTFQFATVHETLDPLWIDLPGGICSGGGCVTRGLLIYLYIYIRYTKHIILHVSVKNYMLYMLLGFICYIYVIRQSYVLIVLCHILRDFICVHTCIMFRLA